MMQHASQLHFDPMGGYKYKNHKGIYLIVAKLTGLFRSKSQINL